MPVPNKRIVVCADGTWNDPEDEHPTNVLRFARAIKPEDDKGVQQIVFYDWGVGSYVDKKLGGAFGVGMMKNIQDGYRFIVQNYDQGDEIAIFGFSRGAYTARALAGMLNKCGILHRKNAHAIPDAFEFYKKKKIKPGSAEAKKWRKQHALAPQRGIVHFIGVWDTVGALGIPTRSLAFVEERDLFFDAELGSNVRFARHAVAIDEHRDDFVPTLWKPKGTIDLKQVWFTGVHTDVGGGSKPKRGKLLSDIPMAWMAREARDTINLTFEPHLHGSLAGLHLAEPHKSHKGFWKLLGRRVREIPPEDLVHESVKKRCRAMSGYRPKPLEGWLKHHGGWGPLET
jgi:uncharacterized protein (DUF2235 family)